jgi:hypothetical protein
MKLDTVGFVGGGNMTQAIAGGLLDNGFDPKLLSIAEPHKPQRDKLAESLQHVFVTADNSAVVARSSCLVLAVKPQILARVCQDLAASVQTVKPLIISIAAGPRIADIDTWLGGNNAIGRIGYFRQRLNQRCTTERGETNLVRSRAGYSGPFGIGYRCRHRGIRKWAGIFLSADRHDRQDWR